MVRTRKPTPSEIDGVEYRRAKTWHMALGMMNNGSAMIFYSLVGLLSYLQNAGYGIAVAVAGFILTATRLLDGIIDPFIAMVIDRFDLKFGKLRFYMLVGWVIRSVAILLLFVWGPDKELGVGFFVVVYIVYIIGSSTNDIAGNMISPVLTNDPKQRPVVGVWATVYSYLFPVVFSLIPTLLLLPKYGNQYTVDMLRETALLFLGCSLIVQILSCIGVTPADKPENFRHLATTEGEPDVKAGDMLRFVKGNSAFLRYVIAMVSDKLAQQVGAQAVVVTMLYGILLGNIQLASIMGMVTMVPAIIFAIIGARYTGKHGAKKAVVFWTWCCLALAAAAVLFCLVVDMRKILAALPLMIIFFGLQLLLNGTKMCVTTASSAMRADIIDYELDRSGKYLPGVVTATYNFIDQLVTSLSATIALGSVALIGYSAVMPQPTDQPTSAILYLTLALLFGLPVVGWVFTLIVMPGYKLDKQAMVEVQRRVAAKKAALQATSPGTELSSDQPLTSVNAEPSLVAPVSGESDESEV